MFLVPHGGGINCSVASLNSLQTGVRVEGKLLSTHWLSSVFLTEGGRGEGRGKSEHRRGVKGGNTNVTNNTL